MLMSSFSTDFMSTAQVTAATAESPPSGDAVAASPGDDAGMPIKDLVDGYDSEEDDPWTN